MRRPRVVGTCALPQTRHVKSEGERMFKGTSFPGRLRWLVLLLPVMVLALAFGQGSAAAANRQGCMPSVPPNPTDPNAPCDSATVSASTTFKINGQLLATNFGSFTGVPLGGCDTMVMTTCPPGT